MKFAINRSQLCPECLGDADFVSHHFDEMGCYHHSLFYCAQDKLYFPVLAEFFPEKLTDDVLILPDFITEYSN